MTAALYKRSWPWVAGIFCLAVIVGIILAAALRGPWLDEFATIWYSDRTLSIHALFRNRWMFESNLPSFYFLSRLWANVAGDDVFALRLINLFPLALLTAWFLRTWRLHSSHRNFLIVFAVLAFSNRFMTWYFPELRSYFIQYCAEIVFLGAAWIGFEDRRRTADVCQLLAMPFLICFHQVTAIFAVAWIIAFGLADLRRGFVARATALGLTTLASLAVTFAFMALQRRNADAVLGQIAWIGHSSIRAAVTQLLGSFVKGASRNWIGVVAAVLLIIRPKWPAWAWIVPPKPSTLRFCQLVIASFVLGSLVVLAVNYTTPVMVDRYFSAVAASAVCILAVMLRDAVTASPALGAFFFANAAIYTGVSIAGAAGDARWNQEADIIASVQQRNPGAPIYVGAVPEGATGADLGYAWYAEHRHFKTIRAAERIATAPLPADSPTIFWAEHSGPTRGQVAAAGGDAVTARQRHVALGAYARTTRACTGLSDRRRGCAGYHARNLNRSLNLSRRRIGGDRDDVVGRQIPDHALHQRGPWPRPRTMLDVVELPHDIAGRTARQRRHRADPL